MIRQTSAAPARADRRDFWLSCGHHLLDRGEGGGLVVTDAFLKAYLARPELLPPDDACPVERTLHAALLADPRQPVDPAIVAEIADADAQDNWRRMLAFRDRLLEHPTLEASYLDLIRRGAGSTPPLFIAQLVHVVLRNVLDGEADPFRLRAAELFFRPQKLTMHGGALLAADQELVTGATPQPTSPLVAMLGQEPADIDVLSEENAETYWQRSDAYDMALDLTGGRRGLAALGDVIARWLAHLLSIEVTVEPVTEVKNARFTWYVGLDQYGTALGDALWRGEEPESEEEGRVSGLFRLDFSDESAVVEAARGGPVYLLMAMAPDMTLRLKPQNLITGLPLRQPEAVT